jgi:F420-dependent oxidoreductase-like protein
MRICIMGLPARGEGVASALREIEETERLGFAGYWLAHTIGVDALTLLAMAGRSTERIGLGTFVIPTYPRHPSAVAQQALTTQDACGGRLTLGIGLSHRAVMQDRLGFDWDYPIRHMREYLTTLNGLLRQDDFEFVGEEFTIRGYRVAIDDVAPPDVVVGALGPQMLRLTGRLADGTALWMGGPRYIADRVVPTIGKAACSAGRPAPRIIAGLPVCVTDRPADVRARAAASFEIYGRLPSYRAILDLEGAEGPEDVALIGSADEVYERLRNLHNAGATEFAGAIFAETATERDATLEVLRDAVGRFAPVSAEREG